MPYISTPPPHPRKVETLAQFLQIHAEWAEKQVPSEGETGFLSQLWYRGVNKEYKQQIPGVYRPEFTARADRLPKKYGLEEKRLNLEREMLSQFRSAGASLLNRESVVEIYFRRSITACLQGS
jgi:hypothetical protein